MKLSTLGEFGLIDKIRELSYRKTRRISLGIGDDAAVLTVAPNMFLLATTDMLLEDVHFDLAITDFYSLGWKSAAANLSDIAAMGGIPRFCLTAIGIPSQLTVEQIAELYRGFHALLSAHRTILVGGDTCSSRHVLDISVTILGEVEKKKLLSRGGAKVGDRVFVTGTLGDSAAGLEILKSKGKNVKSIIKQQLCRSTSSNPVRQFSGLIEKHLRPLPRIHWGRRIKLTGCANAMIDISDGLSSDLSHICEQSRVGALIDAGKIPFSPSLHKAKSYLKHAPLDYALSGGEDYELLFTVPPAKIKKLRTLNIPATEIGEITRGRNLYIVQDGGNRERLKPSGYNHFS